MRLTLTQRLHPSKSSGNRWRKPEVTRLTNVRIEFYTNFAGMLLLVELHNDFLWKRFDGNLNGRFFFILTNVEIIMFTWLRVYLIFYNIIFSICQSLKNRWKSKGASHTLMIIWCTMDREHLKYYAPSSQSSNCTTGWLTHLQFSNCTNKSI